MSGKQRSLASQYGEIQAARRFSPEFNAGMYRHLAVARQNLWYLFEQVAAVAPEAFGPVYPEQGTHAAANGLGEVATIGQIQAQEAAITNALGHGATTPYVIPQSDMERQQNVTAEIDQRVTPDYIREQIAAMQQQFGETPAAGGVAETVVVPEQRADPIIAAEQAVAAAFEQQDQRMLQDA